MLGVLTANLFRPGTMPLFVTLWPVHCATVLSGSLGVLCLCAVALRRVTLKYVTGEARTHPIPLVAPPVLPPVVAAPSVAPQPVAVPDWARPPAPAESPPAPSDGAAPPPPDPPPLPAPASAAQAGIRRIKGSPLLWRECRYPLLGGPATKMAIIAVTAVLLVSVYAGVLAAQQMAAPGVQVFFVLLYLSLGLSLTAVFAATTIAPERESRCWPLLMTTTLDAGRVLRAKIIGVLRRTSPVWALLGGHVLACTLTGVLHPVVLVQLGLVTASACGFVVALCVYLSTRYRRTASAVLASVTVPVALWIVAPAAVSMIAAASGSGHDLPTAQWLISPFYQAKVVTAGSTGWPWLIEAYDWPFGQAAAGSSTLVVAGFAALYGGLGWVLAEAAKRRFRRDVF